MKHIPHKFLTVLSYTAVLVVFAPFIFFLSGFFQYSVATQMILLLLTIVIGFINIAIGNFVYDKLPIPTLAQNILLRIIAIAICLCGIFFIKGYNFFEYAVWGIYLYILLVFSYSISRCTYDNAITDVSIYYITVIFVSSLFLCYLMNFKVSVAMYSVLYFYIFAIHSIAKSTSNLYNLMNRRKFNESFLPSKIKEYNRLLLAVLFSILIALTSFLLLFEPLVLKSAAWLKRGIGLLLKKIFYSSYAYEDDNLYFRFLAFEWTDELDLNKIANRSWSLIDIIPIVIIILLVGFMIYKAGSTFFNSISKKKFKKRYQKHEENQEYFDIEEKIRMPNTVALKKQFRKRDFRKRFKQFHNMNNNFAKYQFGYALALDGLSMFGLEIEKSDTTVEIAQKVKSNTKLSTFADSTDIYNLLYYGKSRYSENFIDTLEKTLSQMLKQI